MPFIIKSIFYEIGGFDENCFMYSDDIDLSYQVLQQGKYNYHKKISNQYGELIQKTQEKIQEVSNNVVWRASKETTWWY